MGLTDHEQRVVRAIGQALFPRNRVIDADAEDVGLVAWVEDYLWRMPPAARTQIRALLRTFDVGYTAWAAHPSARFIAARPADQTAYIDSWTESPTYLQRMLFEALWTVMAFGYVEQAEQQGLIAQGRVPAPQAAAPAVATAEESA